MTNRPAEPNDIYLHFELKAPFRVQLKLSASNNEHSTDQLASSMAWLWLSLAGLISGLLLASHTKGPLAYWLQMKLADVNGPSSTMMCTLIAANEPPTQQELSN